jgi:hypothetical protein
MAKIQEKREPGQGSGKFWTAKDAVGLPLTIVEDVNENFDFRMTELKEGKKGQWFCMECTDGQETKDLHATNAVMREIKHAMPPALATWKGQRFVINSMTGTGFSTQAKVTRLLGDYAAPKGQAQLGDAPKPKDNFPQAEETMPQKTARFLTGLGQGVGIHDSRILDTLTGVYGNKEQADFMFGMLKQSGQITQKADGCWVRA